jgi:hypothetical protein
MKPKSVPSKTIHGIAGEHMRTVPTNIPDVRGVIPPAGLDPLIADRNVLIRHGFPLPPDEKRSPDAARIWRQTLSRQLDHIVPHLRERPEQKTRSRFERGAAGLTSGNWSGGVALTGGPYEFCSGAWIVPAVVAPARGDGDWWSVAWVGIDGDGSNDVLQCGTGHHVNVTNGKTTTEYFAWYEWYPFGWTEITNLTVSPGDAIAASVRYLGIANGAGRATATVTNMTTGQSATVSLTPPGNTVLAGNCAEWIMERPGINGVLADLPEYEHISFYNTVACTATNTINGAQAQPITMVDGTTTLSAAALATSDWDCTFNAAS